MQDLKYFKERASPVSLTRTTIIANKILRFCVTPHVFVLPRNVDISLCCEHSGTPRQNW